MMKALALALCGVAVVLAGCAAAPPVVTSAELLAAPRMSAPKARQVIVALLQQARISPATRAPRPTQITFFPSRLHVAIEMQPHEWGVGTSNGECSVLFDRLDHVHVRNPGRGSYDLTQAVFSGSDDNWACFWYWDTREKAELFAQALLSLRDAPAARESIEAFSARARDWPTPPPELTADARRQKALAEGAFREFRFEDAIDAYGRALAHAPWWAELYYNRALLLAELALYDDAVLEMRKYAMLRPAAAAAVQGRIYVWEEKAR